jgi:hypothetical protein
MIRRWRCFMIKRIVVGAVIAAGSWAACAGARQWYSAWGVDPDERRRGLPGDDLVPGPTLVETRGITIDAPPEAVWPWLVQMGYGRAGWYSYDAIDMKGTSAEAILPEHQALAVGDTVPTDPGGGFLVKVVDRERALVLFVDPEILAARGGAMPAPGEAPGLAMTGRLLETATPPRFNAAWAFVLLPLDGRRTRLIERFSARAEPEVASRGTRLLEPLLGFGFFVMAQRQMTGIRARAEKLARDRAALRHDVAGVMEHAMLAKSVPGDAPSAG